MTKAGRITAIIFIVLAFPLTAFAGLTGNWLALGGWFIAMVLTIAMCINAEDHAEKLQRVAEKGEPLLNVDEKTIDWNRAALQISREERRS